MLTIYLLAFCIKCLIYSVASFRNGPPINQIICETLNPIGHIGLAQRPFNPVPDYEIMTNKDWFVPNELVTGYVTGTARAGILYEYRYRNNKHRPKAKVYILSATLTPFRGLLLQVKNERGFISGSFELSDDDLNYRYYRCDYLIPETLWNGTITNKNNTEKSVGLFRWLAPSSCNGTDYVVRATVIKTIEVYQDGLSKKLECRSRGSAEEEEESRGCAEEEEESRGSAEEEEESLESNVDQRNEVCQFASLTSIPENKYQTSFENNTLNGWNNSGWTFNKGPTLTWNTGPSSAADGETYLYLEASNYMLQKAVLETDQELRGCFCLKFKHNHNVQSKRYHKFAVNVGGSTIYERIDNRAEWTNVYLQIDTENYTKIQFTGYRGRNFRGDMAIDDVKIVPGDCTSV